MKRQRSRADVPAETAETAETAEHPAALSLSDDRATRGTDVRAAVLRLSGGGVRQVTNGGPVLARSETRRRQLRAGTLASVLSTADRLVLAFMSAGWLVCLVVFWDWWLTPAHRISTFGLVANSLVLAYISCFPVLFVIVVNRLRKVSRTVSVPDLRVAFVVTRAPSEDWDMARSTLTAMRAQQFPRDYDVWLCDEQPTPRIAAWCRAGNVELSTRFGVRSYHRQHWPRRTRCKEGNLAYFYDHWGYRDYDVVVQLDCDHRPAPGYLSEMVRPFADPAVGYVAAPSVCDANAGRSWAARGRLHREATFHGPFQLGHNGPLAPSCIGSHYAVRTAALRQIGGIGPELAEDFSTTFLLNAAGWQGVFAIDAEAHGDGPETFSAMLVQEFQWSRSLTTILVGLLPRNFRQLTWRLKFRFLYALSYYILVASATFVGLGLALTAALTGLPWVDVSYPGFLLHWWPIAAWLVLIIVLLRRRGLLRPAWAPIISWESWLYALTRWPYLAWGIGAALWQWLRPRPVSFAVTPKRAAGMQPLPARLIMPYLVISAACSGAAMAGEAFTTTAGYVFLSLLAAVMYGVVVTAVPVLHAREMSARAGVPVTVAVRRTARGPLLLAAGTLALAAVAVASFPPYIAPLLHL